MKAAFIFIALLAPFAPAACNRATIETPGPQSTASAQPTNVKPQTLELTSVKIHKTRLNYSHKVREKDGKERVYEQAWLVLLSFKNSEPVMDTRIDFYIGDYRIPEYGGTNDGIYFRVYDESLLKSLNNQEISVGIDDKGKRSLGKKFSTEGYEALKLEEESAVLKR